MSVIVPGPLHGEVLSPANSVRVYVKRNPFDDGRLVIQVPAGMSLAEIVDGFVLPAAPMVRRQYLVLRVRGEIVPPALWSRVRVKAGITVSAISVPQGKGAANILKALALVAIAVFAAWAAPIIAGAALGAGLITAGFVGAATIGIGAIIAIAGAVQTSSPFLIERLPRQ